MFVTRWHQNGIIFILFDVFWQTIKSYILAKGVHSMTIYIFLVFPKYMNINQNYIIIPEHEIIYSAIFIFYG